MIEDSRKLMQDFIAPELRGIAVSLDALQKRFEILDRKIDEVDSRAEKRSAEAEQRAEKRLTGAQSHTDKQFIDLASRTEKQLVELSSRTEKRFEKIDQRFNKIDQRFDNVDQRFDSMQQQTDRQHEEIMSAFRMTSVIASLQMQTREFESAIKDLQEKQKMIALSIESAHDASSAA